MKLITERTQIRDIVALWGDIYRRNQNVKQYVKLGSMLDPETATAADVAAILGDDTWCKPEKCQECGVPTNISILMGEELDYESSTALLCKPCLEKALALQQRQEFEDAMRPVIERLENEVKRLEAEVERQHESLRDHIAEMRCYIDRDRDR